MNPKKKSRRYRVSVSIHALDLAISRFTHSLGTGTVRITDHESWQRAITLLKKKEKTKPKRLWVMSD
jgi:hypothetical protein